MTYPVFKTYDNGLRLVFKRVEGNRPCSIFVAVDVGSKDEDDRLSGISHFIEHLNFKGTKKRDAKRISTEFEELGANANAFTTKQNTCFYATCLSEKMENCLELLTDMVFDSKYDEKEIERERRVIFEEIDMYEDDPESVAYEDFCKNFYEGSALQRPIIGTKQSLTAMTREDIVSYHAKYYTPQNIVVSIVGDASLSSVEKMVKKYVLDRFSKKESPREKPRSLIVIPNKKFGYLKKDIQQTQIALGFPCDNVYSDKKMAYNLLCFIFGGGMASRLFQSVREEHGLVYSISCLPELFECGGDILISLGTNKANQVKAVELVKAEIDKLLQSGFTEKELERAKTFCKSIIVSSGETTSSMAKSYASNLLTYNKIVSIEERLKQIDEVTLDDLNEIAQKVFDFGNVCGSVVSNAPREDLFNAFN